MTRSDPPPRPQPIPEDTDLLLDALQGELTPRARQGLDARLEADEALRAEWGRLERFLGAVRETQEPAPDAAAALRVALRVRDQVAGEEARAERTGTRMVAGSRRLAWGRILAVSVAFHVALLAIVVVRWQRDQHAEETRPIYVALPTPLLAGDDDVAWEDVPEPWSEPPRAAPIPNAEELATAPPAPEASDLAPLADDLREHPSHVALAMVTRRTAELKRRRLDHYGLDAKGTLGAVRRSLRTLAGRQHEDGSFGAGGGRSPVGQTALALLPFLADGHSSRTGQYGDGVVARGVAWLRRQVRAAGIEDVPASELGTTLRALSEDYVLAYGRLSPADARRRAVELRALAGRIEDAQAEDGSFPGADADVRLAVWPMWGLEAAVRTGAVPVPARVPERFRAWFATAPQAELRVAAAGLLLARALGPIGDAGAAEAHAGVLVASAGQGPSDPFLVAAAGSGLVMHDAAAFRAWNHGWGSRLVSALGPTGLVRDGDPVGDTALHLLALQAAWRTW